MKEKQENIEALKIEMQVAINEFNIIQEKIKELVLVRDFFRMKVISCSEKIKKIDSNEKTFTEIKK